MASKVKWAVLLCFAKPTPGAIHVGSIGIGMDFRIYFQNFFTKGLNGAVDYWNDISFLNIDVSDSAVFGWFQLPFTSAELKTKGRDEYIFPAITMAGIAVPATGGFDHYCVFVTEFGIDAGTASGSQHMSSCLSSPEAAYLFHEMGHCHGLEHTKNKYGYDYGSPYDVMSAEIYGGYSATFRDPKFGASGPGLCAPYSFQAGWLPGYNVVKIGSDGEKPVTTTCILDTFEFTLAPASQAALVDFTTPDTLTYFIEYRRRKNWDRGYAQDAIAVHQLRQNRIAYYMGNIRIFDEETYSQPGEWTFIDDSFNISVRLLGGQNTDKINIRIGQTLRVREIVKKKLGFFAPPGFSLRANIMGGESSVRNRMLELLS